MQIYASSHKNAGSTFQTGKSFIIPTAAAAPSFSIHVDTTSSYVQPQRTEVIKSTDKENEQILLDTALSLPVPHSDRVPLSNVPDILDSNVSLHEESIASASSGIIMQISYGNYKQLKGGKRNSN